MIWIWRNPKEPNKLPYCQFDDLRSRIPSYKIVAGGRLAQQSPADIVVTLTRRKAESLDGLHCLPNVERCPLIDGELQEIVARFAGDDAQFMPVTVRTKDMPVTRYSYARPLNKLPCVDLDKSVITDWIAPGQSILAAPRVVFCAGCLGSRHIVRDSYTSHVLVSDALKTALMETGDKGLRFDPPEILNY